MPCVCACTLPRWLSLNCEKSYCVQGRLGSFQAPGSGLLTQDVTKQWLSLGQGESAAGSFFALELKPKQADKGRSWLIKPSRVPLKSKLSRLRASRAAKVENKSTDRSNVDHETFFHGSKSSMKNAIKVGLNRQTRPVVGCFVGGDRVRVLNQTTSSTAIIASVLAREPLLKRLRAAQREFDCLEDDGVAFILATQKLAGLDIEALLGSRAVGSRLSAKAKKVAAVCRCPPGLLSAVDSNTRRAYRNMAISAIRTLDAPDLLDLLHNWLVALALDDVSIIISFARLLMPTCSRHQTQGHAGVLNMNNGESYAYELAVVDISPKPPSKLEQRIGREGELSRLAKVVLSRDHEVCSYHICNNGTATSISMQGRCVNMRM